MKRTKTVRLFAGTALFTAVALAPIVQAQPKVLGHKIFSQMDANKDYKVSKREYVEYGSAYLEKKGKSVDRDQIEAKFGCFDRNEDGFITAEDAEFKKPGEPCEESECHGIITARVKVDKSFDKRIDSIEKKRPAGTMVITTTQRIKEETQSLFMTVSNTGSTRDTYELCWYFFCRPHDGKAIRVYDEGVEKITLEPRKRTNHNVVAEKISVVEQSVERENENADSYSDPILSCSGDKAEGYLVVLKHGGIILDKKSSSKDFLSDQWLSQL